MPTLVCLSNELLIAVYSASPTAQCAISLASTSRRLRAVWLEHSNQIIPNILTSQIPDYEDAVDLAVLEETWTNTPQSNPHSLRQCLAHLLHNAELASSATAAWNAYIASMGSGYKPITNITSIPASYYLTRKLCLARQHREARLLPALYQTLCASPREAINTHVEFSCFLTSSYNKEHERLKHGIHACKPKEEWTEEDEWYDEQGMHTNVEEWDYATDILDVAMLDRYHGRNHNLEAAMFGWIPWIFGASPWAEWERHLPGPQILL